MTSRCLRPVTSPSPDPARTTSGTCRCGGVTGTRSTTAAGGGTAGLRHQRGAATPLRPCPPTVAPTACLRRRSWGRRLHRSPGRRRSAGGGVRSAPLHCTAESGRRAVPVLTLWSVAPGWPSPGPPERCSPPHSLPPPPHGPAPSPEQTERTASAEPSPA